MINNVLDPFVNIKLFMCVNILKKGSQLLSSYLFSNNCIILPKSLIWIVMECAQPFYVTLSLSSLFLFLRPRATPEVTLSTRAVTVGLVSACCKSCSDEKGKQKVFYGTFTRWWRCGELQFNYYIYALTVQNGTFVFSLLSKYMNEKVKWPCFKTLLEVIMLRPKGQDPLPCLWHAPHDMLENADAQNWV